MLTSCVIIDYDMGNKRKTSRVDYTQIVNRRKRLFQEGSEFLQASREDVVGIDKVLGIADQLIDWLRNFKTYETYGARPEPGVLFEGEPGTGKTLVSRYIASATNALFIDVRDFGHEQERLRDTDIAEMFRMAREARANSERPVILFWDEFESYAMERMRASVEQASVVSQLTAELDGIKGKSHGILVIGCTNYGDVIDEALTRPGRMGLVVEFNAPDRIGKTDILRHYVDKFPAEDLDLDAIGYFMAGDQTAAAIEEIAQEAWRNAVRSGLANGHSPYITNKDLMDVCLDRMIGPATSLQHLSATGRVKVAVHECGHALLALKLGIPLMLVTIRPTSGGVFGQTQMGENPILSREQDYRYKQIAVTYGGLIAEAICGFSSVGGGGDMQGATRLILRAVDDSGYFFPLSIAEAAHHREQPASDWLLEKADRKMLALAKRQKTVAWTELSKIAAEDLWRMGEQLAEVTTMSGPQFAKLAATVLGDDWSGVGTEASGIDEAISIKDLGADSFDDRLF